MMHPILPESPRYLFAAGKPEEAEAVLRRVMSPDEATSCMSDMEASSAQSRAMQGEDKSALEQLWCPNSTPFNADSCCFNAVVTPINAVLTPL